MGLPQFIYLGLFFVGLGITLSRFGEPKRDRYDWGDIIASFAVLGLLYWGGFFSGGVR